MDDEQSLLNEPEPRPNAAAEAFAHLSKRVAAMEERLDGRMAVIARALERGTMRYSTAISDDPEHGVCTCGHTKSPAQSGTAFSTQNEADIALCIAQSRRTPPPNYNSFCQLCKNLLATLLIVTTEATGAEPQNDRAPPARGDPRCGADSGYGAAWIVADIAEAASRPMMRFVELKSQEQLDIQTLHRGRSRLVAERTNLINQLRAILLERGVIFPAGRRKFELGLDAMLTGEDTTLSPRQRQLVGELRAEWRVLDAKIEALNGEFVELARNDPAARRLTSIPGVGVLNAAALIAAVGNASGFAKARDLGAWLGLVPRQHTTGGKPWLLGISKRGNTYLRTLLIHGARAALPSLSQSDTPLGRWLKGMIERGVHRNAVVVALANKLARIAWAALRKETTFERCHPVAA